MTEAERQKIRNRMYEYLKFVDQNLPLAIDQDRRIASYDRRRYPAPIALERRGGKERRKRTQGRYLQSRNIAFQHLPD
jgi:hypothetical protein